MTCPWCGGQDVEQLALYGAQLMADQHYCRSCRNFFGRIVKR